MRKNLVLILIVFQVIQSPSHAMLFRCEQVMRSHIPAGADIDPESTREILEQAATHYAKGEEMSLEASLSLVGDLLGPTTGAQFREEVNKILSGVDVVGAGKLPNQVEERGWWNRKLRSVTSRFTRVVNTHYRVRWERPKFSRDLSQLTSNLFEAIRAAFSKDTVDAHTWNKAKPQERIRLSAHFHRQAQLVLFYQFRLYLALKRALEAGEKIQLPSEGDLHAYRKELGPSRFLLWKSGKHIFQEIRLNAERIEEIERQYVATPPTDNEIKRFFHDFTYQRYIVNLESLCKLNSHVLLEFVTVGGLALGLLLAGSRGWFGDTPQEIPEVPSPIVPMTPVNSPDAAQQQAERMLHKSPKEAVKEQLRELEKRRLEHGALTEEELLIEKSLKALLEADGETDGSTLP